MVTADVHAAVAFARDVVDLIPAPPRSLRDDEVSQCMWADLMVSAASGLAAAYQGRAEVLKAAIGPAVEVGVNPPWRVLLILAHARLAGVPQELMPPAARTRTRAIG